MVEQSEIRNPQSKILVVEDSPVQAEALRRTLVKEGYEVCVAKDGAEGLAMAQKERPHLVISDIMMPVMDGYEMCRKIKESKEMADIPVLLLTQLIEPEEVIRGLESGAYSYLTKPYSEGFLLSKVKYIMENPDRYRNRPDRRSIEFEYDGKHYEVHSSRTQTLSYLITTYENAVLKNRELAKAQEELHLLNEQLEEKVRNRTAALSAEVSERKRAEEALRINMEQLRTITEMAADAIICIEPPDTIYMWNRKAEEMFGCTASEAMGKSLHQLIVPEKYREKANEGLKAFFQTGTGPIIGKTVEMSALRKDGTEFPVELSISAIRMGDSYQATGIIRDITERKAAEEKLKQHVEELERFKKATIQRELRMKELRDKVEELEKGTTGDTGKEKEKSSLIRG